jgi:WD40 repeat protein
LVFAAFSPDSTRLVTLSKQQKGIVHLWNAASGDRIGGPLEHGHALFLTCAGISHDNRSIVTACARDDGQYVLVIWDATHGTRLDVPDMILEGHPGAAGFSQDGTAVLAWSHQDMVGIWDAASGAPIADQLPCASWVDGVGESRTDLVNMSAHPFAPQIRQFLAATVRNHQGLGNGDGGYSPDCTRIVGPGKDTYAYVWDVLSGKLIQSDFRHDDFVRTAYFSPSGKCIVTASEDGTARIWDSVSGECLVPPLSHQKSVVSASFSPDETRVVTACEDGFARVWSVQTGMRSGPALRHPSVVDVLFSPDGQRIVTCGSAWGEPDTVHLWDATTGQGIGSMLVHEQAT